MSDDEAPTLPTLESAQWPDVNQSFIVIVDFNGLEDDVDKEYAEMAIENEVEKVTSDYKLEMDDWGGGSIRFQKQEDAQKFVERGNLDLEGQSTPLPLRVRQKPGNLQWDAVHRSSHTSNRRDEVGFENFGIQEQAVDADHHHGTSEYQPESSKFIKTEESLDSDEKRNEFPNTEDFSDYDADLEQYSYYSPSERRQADHRRDEGLEETHRRSKVQLERDNQHIDTVRLFNVPEDFVQMQNTVRRIVSDCRDLAIRRGKRKGVRYLQFERHEDAASFAKSGVVYLDDNTCVPVELVYPRQQLPGILKVVGLINEAAFRLWLLLQYGAEILRQTRLSAATFEMEFSHKVASKLLELQCVEHNLLEDCIRFEAVLEERDDTDDEEEVTDKNRIVVRNVPYKTRIADLKAFVSNRDKFGGGEVLDMQPIDHSRVIVTYRQEKDARSALNFKGPREWNDSPLEVFPVGPHREDIEVSRTFTVRGLRGAEESDLKKFLNKKGLVISDVTTENDVHVITFKSSNEAQAFFDRSKHLLYEGQALELREKSDIDASFGFQHRKFFVDGNEFDEHLLLVKNIHEDEPSESNWKKRIGHVRSIVGQDVTVFLGTDSNVMIQFKHTVCDSEERDILNKLRYALPPRYDVSVHRVMRSDRVLVTKPVNNLRDVRNQANVEDLDVRHIMKRDENSAIVWLKTHKDVCMLSKKRNFYPIYNNFGPLSLTTVRKPPETLIYEIDEVWEFIERFCKQDFEQNIKRLSCTVTTSQKQVEIDCTIKKDKDADTLALFMKWEAEVPRVVEQYRCQFSMIYRTIVPDIAERLDGMLNSSTDSSIKFYSKSEKDKLTVVCRVEDKQRVEKQIQKHIDVENARIEDEKKHIEARLRAVEAQTLDFFKKETQIKSKFHGVDIQFCESEFEIILRGPTKQVRSVECYYLEIMSQMCTEEVRLDRIEYAKLCRRDYWRRKIIELFKDLPVVHDIEGSSVHLYSPLQSALIKAREIFEKSFHTEVCLIQDSCKQTINDKWSVIYKDLENYFQDKFVAVPEEVEGKMRVHLFADAECFADLDDSKDIISRLDKRVHSLTIFKEGDNFVSDSCARYLNNQQILEKMPFLPGTQVYITKCGSENVITRVGLREGLDDAKTKIGDLLASILFSTRTCELEGPGVQKYFTSTKGRERITQIESEHGVGITQITGAAEKLFSRQDVQDVASNVISDLQVGSKLLRLIQGDIVKQQTDAIVNASNKFLALGGSVSGAIAKKAGKELQTAMSAIANSQGGQLPIGTAHTTSSFQMKDVNFIIHAIGPSYKSGSSEEINALGETVVSVVKECNKNSCKSVTIPAISCGTFAGDLTPSIKMIFEKCVESLKNPATSLERIEFIDLGDKTLKLMMKLLESSEYQHTHHNQPVERKMKQVTQACDEGASYIAPPTNTGSCYVRVRQNEYRFDKLAIKVELGSIADTQGKDAIVIPPKGRVAKNVLENAGGNVKAEVDQATKSNNEARVLVTSGGNLSRYLLHCAAMEKYDSNNEEKGMTSLRDTVNECFDVAKKNGCQSIAFPTLGGGPHYGFPTRKIIKVILDQIEKHAESSLASLTIFAFDDRTCETIKKEIDKRCPPPGATAHRQFSTTASLTHTVKGSVRFEVIGDKDENVEKSCETLENLAEGLVEEKSITLGDSFHHISAVEMDKLKGKASHLQVDFKIHGQIITINGLGADLVEIKREIEHLIRRVEEGKKTAVELAKRIQWQYIENERWRDFDPYLNRDIENASQSPGPILTVNHSDGTKSEIHFKELKQKFPNGEYRIIQRNDKPNELPRKWVAMGPDEQVKLYTLDDKSHEYNKIRQLFESTSGGRTVTRIQRIQNPTLYTAYKAKLEKVAERNNKDVKSTQMRLWHGTKTEAGMTGIITNGFDRGYQGTASGTAHGKGVYFAANASLSVNYTAGLNRMLLSWVITGETTKSSSGYFAAPMRTGNIPYDCVVDNPSNPSVFVIFQDSAASPEYIVHFQ